MEFSKKIETLSHQYYYACDGLKAARGELKAARGELKAAEEAQEFVQKMVERIQSQIHNQIAGVVTRCLQAVFGESYEFVLEFQRKRGRTEAHMILLKDGEEEDPNASGGGVLDIISFALRMCGLMMSRPRLRRTLILDEPFKFVSKEYLPLISDLLRSLSTEMEVQIIMVTHIEELKIGNVKEIR